MEKHVIHLSLESDRGLLEGLCGEKSAPMIK